MGDKIETERRPEGQIISVEGRGGERENEWIQGEKKRKEKPKGKWREKKKQGQKK